MTFGQQKTSTSLEVEVHFFIRDNLWGSDIHHSA